MAHDQLLSRTEQPAKWLPVLMYHRVVERANAQDPHHCNITTADFESQLSYLSRCGYETISLDSIPQAIGPQSPWRKPVAISFDDGYRDTYTHAFPLLKKYGATATVMLVSDCIGGVNTWDSGVAEPAPLLSLEEIQEMQRHGICFGAHSASHPSLPDISLKAAREELFLSKSRLEQLLGNQVCTLAYPYNRCTPEICRIAEEAGFIAAFGGQPKLHTLFNFSRINSAAFRGDTRRWRLQISGFYHRLKHRRGMRTFDSLRKSLSRNLWNQEFQAETAPPQPQAQ